MDKKKLLIIILVLILLVVSAVLLTIKLFDLENETVKTTTENVIENSISNNVVQNEVSNNVVNNTVQNNVNNVVQNETNNNPITNTKQEEIKQEVQTNEEKAVAIVEKIWKNEKNVYCSFEEVDGEGNYIVCVRDKETTRALYWYTVNIETGKATIK